MVTDKPVSHQHHDANGSVILVHREATRYPNKIVWETLDRRKRGTYALLSQQTLTLSYEAFAAIGSPRRVVLLFDAARRIVGIKPRDGLHSYLVQQQYYSVSFAKFRRYYDVQEKGRYAAFVRDGVVCIPLGEKGSVNGDDDERT